MASFSAVCLVLLTFSVAALGLVSNTTVEKSDQLFKEYLLNSTQNFTTWLKDMKQDPIMVNGSVTIKSNVSSATYLKCQLSNMQASGHSNDENHKFETESAFNSFYFSITRHQNQSNSFQGNFTCIGNITMDTGNFYFSGNGSFVVNATGSEERLTVTNVGITENYLLNLTLAYRQYTYNATVTTGELDATWNDTNIIGDSLNAIRHEFTNLFYGFMALSQKETQDLHPLRPLLISFAQINTESLNLTSIIPVEDLPSPVIPTPSPPPQNSTTTMITSTTPVPGKGMATGVSGSGMCFLLAVMSMLKTSM